MKKITILALHMGYGGVENALATLVNNICSEYDVEIVSTYKLYDKEVYPINSKVKITYLINSDIALKINKYRKSKHFLKSAFKDYKYHIFKFMKDIVLSIIVFIKKKTLMIKYIKNMKTDIVLSTRLEYNYYISKYATSPYKIAWEHNHGDMQYIKEVLASCYNVDRLVLVSNELYNLYNSVFHHPKLSYIPNAVDEMPSKVSELDNKKIISVGRLAEIKGYDDMIDVMNFVHDMDAEITLEIIGDGEKKEELIDKIKEKKLEDVISIVGFKDKKYINEKLASSSLFLSTSHSESFGIVAIEAMAAGVPTVAFDSAEGFKELIDGTNGCLVSNRDKIGMANLIIKLLGDKKTLKELGRNAYEKSLNYTKDSIHDKWIEVFKNE